MWMRIYIGIFDINVMWLPRVEKVYSMRMKSLSAYTLIALVLSGAAQASETIRYVYDAKGRVTRVERTGSINNGVTTAHEYDRANNRRRVIITGSPNAPPP